MPRPRDRFAIEVLDLWGPAEFQKYSLLDSNLGSDPAGCLVFC